MIRIPGRIPVYIHPAFWIIAALIGFLNSFSLFGTLIWMAIILFSVLLHEYGHGVTALVFGQKPRIDLVFWGGVTSYRDGKPLSAIKQFFIVLNGPLFGLLVYVVATLLLLIPSLAKGTSLQILHLTQVVNIFWTILNVLPIMPLDGGQLVRVVLEAAFGIKGFRYTLFASTALSLLISLAFFLYGAFLVGAIFFLLAFYSYDSWRKSRTISEVDRDEGVRRELEDAETALQEGRKPEAERYLQAIRAKTGRGMLYKMATQTLAALKYEEGQSDEAYQMLLALRQDLDSDALCVLQRAAYDQQDYALTVELASVSFQYAPSVETALRNAFAFACLGQAQPAVGWLQTAVDDGLDNLAEIIDHEALRKIRQHPAFVAFLKAHHLNEHT